MADLRTKGLTVKAAEEEQAGFHFEGYLSTFGNTDRDGDVIVKGAFDESLKDRTVVPMLFNHDRNRVVGKLELSVDETGLKVKGTFNEKDSDAMRVKDLIDMGALDSMSVGMAVKDYEPIEPNRPFGGWNIKSADVYEGSVVTIPANAQALISSTKSLDEAERRELQQLRLEKRKAEALAKFEN